MDDYADLIITLSKLAEDAYIVELRFSRPGDLGEKLPERGPALFKFVELGKVTRDPQAYGLLLKDALFGDAAAANVREFFKQCLAVTQDDGHKLRLRVLVDRSALELHDLRWETLSNLAGDEFIAIDQECLFSRFLYSSDWSRIELRPRKKLRALVVVSNPSDLKNGKTLPGGQKLAEVDVEGELERARESLQDIDVIDELASHAGEPGRVTLENLETRLKQGYDFLYLACHGALLADDPDDPDSPRQPHLWLEKADGTSDRVLGEELVDQIRHLPAVLRPRLVVLASCQSAGKGQVPGEYESADQGALAALGPRVVETGVPAVLAMQDNVTMATVAQFMPVFFEELLKEGRVDRAMMEARWKVRKRKDWWMPVLFLRLRGGRLWYDPGFERDFGQWPGIANSINQGRCIPVLGSELLEFLAGPMSEIARSWAKDYDFPLASRNLGDFAQVAQYLSIQHGSAFPRDQLLDHLKVRLTECFPDFMPADAPNKTLQELITLIGAQHQAIPSKNYGVLARLPFPIYINANPDNLLEEALRAQDPPREPQVLFFCWKSSLITGETIQAHQQLQEPSPEKPLVYHLFGHVGEPESLVLTEDDYFEYLMWINKTNASVPIPDRLITAWKESALLFLGFQLRDWNFRVLFRSIFNAERRQMGREYRSVAVQLQPGDDYLRPGSARRYLERYFPSDKFDIYWGSADDFLEELWEHWPDKGG